MFRKDALPIAILSAICAALFYSWIGDVFKETPAITIIVFMVYFIQFTAIISAIYDIKHKIKVKANKNMLGCGICGVILFTSFFKGFEYSSIFLAFVFVVALVCLVILGNIGAQYGKNDTTKEE